MSVATDIAPPDFQRAPTRKRLWVCVGLTVAVLAVYLQVRNFQFVNYDDPKLIVENPHIQHGLTWHAMQWAFTSGLSADPLHSDHWWPLTSISHALVAEFFGMDPGAHHLVNVALHLATTIALFLLLEAMTGAFWRSAFIAVVFGVHPLHVESVAWVTSRGDVLSGFFFVATLGAYVGYARQPVSRGSYVSSLALFVLGLMCRPIIVTLPAVLLLLDYWPLNRWNSAADLRRLLVEKLPFFGAAAFVASITAAGPIYGDVRVMALPLAARLSNAVVSYTTYLSQLFYPARLAAFYPHPGDALPQWQIISAATLVIAVSVGVFLLRRTRQYLLVGWLWYLSMLVPVIGLVSTGSHAHADRYTYLPHIGLYLALTWLVAEQLRRWHSGAVALPIAAVTVVPLTMMASVQTSYWRNSEALWKHTIEATRGNYVAHANLSLALLKEGRREESEAHVRAALAINPQHAESLNNLGNLLMTKGHLEEAIDVYQKAIRSQRRSGYTFDNLGFALLKKGNVAEAISCYRKALDDRPDFALAHFHLASALLQEGRLADALPEFREALRLDANFARAEGVGWTLLKQGKEKEAIAHFIRKVELETPTAERANNLAWSLATAADAAVRDGPKALHWAEEANRLAGDAQPVFLRTLAAAYAECHRFPEARETARNARELAEERGDSGLATSLGADLNSYEAGNPLRVRVASVE